VDVAEVDVTGDELDTLAGRRRQTLNADGTQRVQLLLHVLLEQQQLNSLAHQNHFCQTARAPQTLHLHSTLTSTPAEVALPTLLAITCKHDVIHKTGST